MNLAEIGLKLKSAREEKGLQLSDVAFHTKISARVLESIESGYFDKMPPSTVLKGFIRTYSQFVGISYESLSGLMVSDSLIKSPEVKDSRRSHISEEVPPTGEEKYIRPLSQLVQRFGIAPIVISTVIVLFILAVLLKSRAPDNETLPAVMMDASPTATAMPTVTPAATASATPAKAETSPTPVATAKAVVVPTATSAPAATASAIAKPSPSAAPKPSASPKPSATPKPSASPKPSATPKPSASPKPSATPQSKELEIVIEALDVIKIDIKTDQEGSKSMQLDADQTYRFKASGRVTIDVSDGGALNLTVNGADRGVPGELGRSMKITLP